MSRLVAFGCSYTYGQGLSDCHIEPDRAGNLPSKFAWPNVLAAKLGTDVVNCSCPGSSNSHILWRILNFKFEPTDVCAVMWTHFGREPFSKLNFNPEIVVCDTYENTTLQTSPLILTEENLVARNYILMHHAYLHLLNANIKHCSIIAPKDAYMHEKPNINIPTLINEPTWLGKFCVDLSLDNIHPGPKSHVNIAEEYYNKLNVLY